MYNETWGLVNTTVRCLARMFKGFLLALIFPFALLACSPAGPKQFVSLTSVLDVPSDEWVVVVAPEILRTTAYHHQVCFKPGAPFKLADDPMGIVDQSNQPVFVQAVVSQGDTRLDLHLKAYQGSAVCFGISDTGLEQSFDKVHLFASQAFTILDLEWQSTDK